MSILTMQEVDLKGKRVLIREDLNVPMKNGKITSDARIKAAIPTIKQALEAGAAVMVMSHLGRPVPGHFAADLSLEPVAKRLSKRLDMPVRFEQSWLEGVEIEPGEVVLLENVRFNMGEKENSENLARSMAALCDVFVMDAFATAHRAEASTASVSLFAKVACAGPLLAKEIAAIEVAMDKPKHPVVAIVGGAKVSTKLKLLESLSKQVDCLIVGGGIANTFIAAQGYSIGKSLYEPELIDEALRITEEMQARGAALPLPTDVVVAERLAEDVESDDTPVDQIDDDEKIFDIGPETLNVYCDYIKKAGTIIWNGPVGVFEFPPFAKGTEKLAAAIAKSKAMSLAGGGDTLVAIEKYGIADSIDYISTGGGAFLACLEGAELPAIKALRQREIV